MNETAEEIIGVIGAGTMGRGIAQVAVMTGRKVFLFDSNADVLRNACDGLKKTFDRLVEKGKLKKEAATDAFQKIKFASSLSDLSECDLIIEAIIENLEIKQKLFVELEDIVKSTCILASNTSSLSLTAIASSCKKDSRVIGIHFFNPAPLMPLVEIIPGIATSESTIAESKKIIESFGKTTVVAKDTPGFIVNRIARPYYGEAIRIFEEQWRDLPAGEKGMATIDWAMREIGGFKMGPFELMDLIGNDVNYIVTETVWKNFFFDSRYKPSLTQKRLYESRRFGLKTGRGYFDYSNGSAPPEPEKNADLGNHIFWRILSMLINEAADALYYNIATKEDIDNAMIKGVNYPKGLLRWCDEVGAGKIHAILSSLHKIYSEDRYRSSILLQHMAKENTKFYN